MRIDLEKEKMETMTASVQSQSLKELINELRDNIAALDSQKYHLVYDTAHF